MTRSQMEALRNSMQTYGYLTPVIVDQNNKIADGEHRALVYKEMGYSTIPAYRLTLETDNDRRMIRQVMNKLHGEHDRQLDSNELATIFQRNSNDLVKLAELIDKRKQDLEDLITAYHPEIWFSRQEDFDAAKALEEIVPATKLGDLYQLDTHRIICGDCTDKRLLDRLFEGSKVDLVFADPPYNIGFEYKEYEDTKTDLDYAEFCNNWFSLLNCEQIIITPGPNNLGFWLSEHKPKDIGIWHKPNGQSASSLFQFRRTEPILFFGTGWDGNSRQRMEDMFVYSSQGISEQLKEVEHDAGIQRDNHAPAKPLGLIADLLKHFSESGQRVFDPFTGSGTTLIAAEQTGRNFFGVEIDPHYCDVIISRWEKYTGKKAVKL